MELNRINALTTHINAAADFAQEATVDLPDSPSIGAVLSEGTTTAVPANPQLEAQALNLTERVARFDGNATDFNNKVDAFKTRNAETASLMNGSTGLDTAIKVFIFIAVAAIIAFVFLSAFYIAFTAILLSIILPAVIAGSVLLTTILAVAKAAVDGSVANKALGYQMEYTPLKQEELRHEAAKRDIEALIADHNNGNVSTPTAPAILVI